MKSPVRRTDFICRTTVKLIDLLQVRELLGKGGASLSACRALLALHKMHRPRRIEWAKFGFLTAKVSLRSGGYLFLIPF